MSSTPTPPRNKLLRTIASTTLLRGVARGLGALIPFFLAAWFGVTKETDAFFFVYAIVMFFTGTFSGVLETLIVPFVVELRREAHEDVGGFLGAVLFWAGVLITVLIGLALGTLRPALHWFSAMPSSQVNLVWHLFAEVAPLLILSTLTSILSGAMNACSLFVVPAISPGFRSVVSLGFIFVFRNALGVHAVVWGYVLGELVRLASLWSALTFRSPLSLRATIRFPEQVRMFFKTVIFRSLGMLAVAFNPIIDRAMVISLGVGAVSIVDYADKIFAIPMIFVNEGFLVVILSHWADLHYNDKEGVALKREVARTCVRLSLISLAVAVVLFVFGGQLVDLVYGGRKISPEQLAQIGRVLGAYMLGFVPLMLVITLGRGFLVLKKVRFLMMTGFLNTALKVLLNLVFIRWIGLQGVAWSTSAVQTILLLVSLEYFRRCFRTDKAVFAAVQPQPR